MSLTVGLVKAIQSEQLYRNACRLIGFDRGCAGSEGHPDGGRHDKDWY